MAPEDLEALVLSGTLSNIADALAPLSEAERKRLSTSTSSLYRQIFSDKPKKDASAALKAALKSREHNGLFSSDSPHIYSNSALAVLGVCPLSQVQRVNFWLHGSEDEDCLIKVLTDRRPEWIDSWIEQCLGSEFSKLSWRVVRRLITTGVASKPDSDGYVQLLAGGITNRWISGDVSAAPLSQSLLEVPDVLEEDIWQLFQVETSAFAYDWTENSQHAPASYESWTAALVKLVEQGHIDRERLLDASLAGLHNGFKQNILGGMHKLHTRLKSNPAEIKQREEQYRDLLTINVGHVAAFALKALGTLEKKGDIAAAQFLDAATSVLSLSTKGPPTTALKLAKRLVDRDETLKMQGCSLATAALTHPSADLQEFSLDLLEQWLGPDDEATRATILDCADHLSPSLQAKARRIAKPANGSDTHLVATTAALAVATPDTNELKQRVNALDETTRQLAGLAEHAGSTLATSLPSALAYHLIEVPVLSDFALVNTIETLDVLIEAVSHAVELVDSPLEAERILDGISRLCGDRPDDFPQRTAPLLKRLETFPITEGGRGLVNGWGATSLALADLLGTWLTGSLYNTPVPEYAEEVGPFRIMSNRIRELIARVHQRRPAPLLALPTHEGGWIDPTVLVARLDCIQKSAMPPLQFDFTQAILRLAPDSRDLALDNMKSLGGVYHRTMRWALGSDDGPNSGDKKHYDLWIAASRARYPHGSLGETLKVLQLQDDLPDALEPAVYSWKSTVRKGSYGHPQYKTYYSHPRIELTSFAQGGKPPDEPPEDFPNPIFHQISLWQKTSSLLDTAGDAAKRVVKKVATGRTETDWRRLPTAGMHQSKIAGWSSAELQCSWLIHWLASVWPLNLDSYFAFGTRCMMLRIDENASNIAPNHAFLSPLFDPGRPWTEMSNLALCVALISKDADLRGLAIDALIEGVDDGRADPEQLAQTLIKIADGQWLKVNRLAEALGQAAQPSDSHRLIISETIQRFCAGLSETPRNAHLLLQLLLDLLVELECGPSEIMIERLTKIKGSGKAAKLAKTLIALSSTSTVIRERATVQIILSRIERAERWKSSSFKDRA